MDNLLIHFLEKEEDENTLGILVIFTIFQSYLDLDLLWHFIVLQVKKLLFFCSLVVEESK